MENKTIIIKNLDHFDLTKTLESGQCFRWKKVDENQYVGVAYNRTIKIGQINNDIYIDHSNPQDFKYIWKNYFDLQRDYEHLKTVLSLDPILKKAIDYADGLHILRQEPFETLITYIISANNNIPRIRSIIKKLCEVSGDKMVMDGDDYYSFPSLDKLAAASKEEIDLCKAGFRGAYISKTAKLANELKYDFGKLKHIDYIEAKESLKRFSGVGDKVADCVLLFTGSHTESFPVDVWVKRVMEKLYFRNEKNVLDIASFGREHFGKYAGFANNYLFYYIRNTEKD